MELNQDVIIYLLGLAAMSGTIWTKISLLEKKVDKHNSVIERVYKLEGQVKNLEKENENAK